MSYYNPNYMHQIKQVPEDFIVREIGDVQPENNGQYAYYILKKTGYTTIGALEVLSKKFRIPLKHFGFAGNKDKNAVTEQKISVFRGSRNFESCSFSNISLKYLGNGKKPISLGDLEGNDFVITIRNLDDKTIEKIKNLENEKIKIPNKFGPQRFSKNNSQVGKAIIKRDFKKATELVLENEGSVENKIRNCLENSKNDWIGGLRLIPLKTLRLFVHSYQSFLFNEIADEYLKNNKITNTKIPLVGFDFEINSIKDKKLKELFKKIIEKEKICPRDFVISQIPELTSESSLRGLFFELKFRILEIGNDELSENRQKININFTLPKSCYATVALEFLLQQP